MNGSRIGHMTCLDGHMTCIGGQSYDTVSCCSVCFNFFLFGLSWSEFTYYTVHWLRVGCEEAGTYHIAGNFRDKIFDKFCRKCEQFFLQNYVGVLTFYFRVELVS